MSTTEGEIETLFLIKLRKKVAGRRKGIRASKEVYIAEFLHATPAEIEGGKGGLDLKARVFPEEFKAVVKKFGCIFKEGKVFIPDMDVYNLLTIYAAVRSTIRSPRKIALLLEIIDKVNSYDAQYWAAKFRETFWEYKKYRPLYRVSRSFKELFGI